MATKSRIPAGPTAGLWMAAALSLAAIAGGISPGASPAVAVAGAVCFTLSAGFLAVAEAISGRSP